MTGPGEQYRPETPRPSSAWLIIFTDLTALMLTFFVMLFSMSSVKIDRWKEMTDALTQTLNPARTKAEKLPTAKYNISAVFRRRAINLDYLEAVLGEKIQSDDLLAAGRFTRLDDRLVFSMPGDQLFPPGGADLSEGGQQALFNLGGVLRHLDNQITVNAHLDPGTVAGDAYASNWELSVARSIVVANALRRAGYGREIFSYGYGDSRFSSLASAPEEDRAELARRIDLTIMSISGTN